MTVVYEALNIFFLVFHSVLLVFNVLGWIPRATRRWNLVTLGLTLVSWLGLGAFYGLGYCVCTDWHWRVRRALGIHDPYDSYVQFLMVRVTGVDVSAQFAFWLTAILFSLAIVMSIAVNLRDLRAARSRSIKNPAKES
jgi:hypothetical protein